MKIGTAGRGPSEAQADDKAEIHELLATSWNDYAAFVKDAALVQPSLPVLFFGDLAACRSSTTRIVTVGLNPSRREFPQGDPFLRFPRAAFTPPRRPPLDDHEGALSDYFRVEPYRAWFASYRPVLQGLDADYYDGAPSTAIHTDICSPLATDPTWSGLTVGQRLKLQPGGLDLWHRLIRRLKPHVVLVSVAFAHLERLEFRSLTDWENVYTLLRDRPYTVRARRIQITDEHASVLVFAPAANTPMGLVNMSTRRVIGRAIKDRFGLA